MLTQKISLPFTTQPRQLNRALSLRVTHHLATACFGGPAIILCTGSGIM
jgi:hypothetical protein